MAFKFFTERQKGFILSASVILFLYLLIPNQNVKNWDIQAFHLLQKKTNPTINKLKNEMIVIKIGDKAANQLNWPLPRNVYASLIQMANFYKLKVIAFDILFLNQSFIQEHDQVMVESIKKSKVPIIFGSDLNNINYSDTKWSTSQVFYPLSDLAHHPRVSTGHLKLKSDHKGMAYKIDHQVDIHKQKKFEPSFSYQISRYFSYARNTGENSEFIYYFFKENQFNSIDLVDLLEKTQNPKEREILAKKLKGKIAIVGLTSSSIGDIGASPFGGIWPLVYAHINSALSLSLKNVPNLKYGKSLFLLFFSLGIIFLCSFFKEKYSFALFFLYIISFCSFSFLTMKNNYSLFYPAGLLFFPIVGFIFQMGFNLFQKEKANVLLSKAFSSYVDKGLLDTILKNQESLNLLGEQKKISIIFSDIKGYTELSNTFPPQVILETLREYLDIMVTQITFNGGTVDKIMGDGIMALFNAPIDLPNYSEKSLKAALNMQKSMVQLQKKWHLEGKTNLTIRIGIATNTVFVGNLGSEDHLEYTAIGNAVNLAARLESSSPPGGILVCKETYKLNKNTFNFRPISGLNLKGFKKGYTAYLVQSLFNNENQNENLISKGDLNKKERRDELRFEQNIPIEIQFHKNSYSGNIINHSVSGLSFFSKKVFEINQTISISINLTSFLDSNIDIFENNFEAKNALIYVELKITWSELDLINLYGGKIQHYRCQSKKLINYFLSDFLNSKIKIDNNLIKGPGSNNSFIFNLNEFNSLNSLISINSTHLPKIWEKQIFKKNDKKVFYEPGFPTINPNSFFELISKEFAFAKRYHLSFLLVLFEITNFNELKETYGLNLIKPLIEKFKKNLPNYFRNNDYFSMVSDEHLLGIFPATQSNDLKNLIGENLANLDQFHINIEKDNFITISLKISIREIITENYSDPIYLLTKLYYDHMENNPTNNTNIQWLD